MPAWNATDTIRASLRSIQRQTLPSWECVVIDDGSGDDTVSAVRAFAALDRRIRLVTQPHLGLVAALNEGLRHVHAPLVARMDADDLMHRDRLLLQVSTLQRNPHLDAVGCHVRIFPRRGMSERLRAYEAWLNSLNTESDVARDAFVECPVVHPTLVMRRGMAALQYEDRGWPEDYDLVLRALASGMRIGMTPRRLLAWRDGARRASRRDATYSMERFVACKAYYLAAGFLARADQYVLWGYGATGRMLRAALARRDRTPACIVEVKRSRIGQRIHGAPVIAIPELASLRGVPVVVSVARQGPRSEIRGALAAMNFIEGRDYVCAA